MYGKVCARLAGEDSQTRTPPRVRRSVLSQFPNLTLDVSRTQHRAQLCVRMSLGVQVPLSSVNTHGNNSTHTCDDAI